MLLRTSEITNILFFSTIRVVLRLKYEEGQSLINNEQMIKSYQAILLVIEETFCVNVNNTCLIEIMLGRDRDPFRFLRKYCQSPLILCPSNKKGVSFHSSSPLRRSAVTGYFCRRFVCDCATRIFIPV